MFSIFGPKNYQVVFFRRGSVSTYSVKKSGGKYSLQMILTSPHTLSNLEKVLGEHQSLWSRRDKLCLLFADDLTYEWEVEIPTEKVSSEEKREAMLSQEVSYMIPEKIERSAWIYNEVSHTEHTTSFQVRAQVQSLWQPVVNFFSSQKLRISITASESEALQFHSRPEVGITKKLDTKGSAESLLLPHV